MADPKVDYAYDIDASGNLVHGDRLYFAYSGSGVATFIDSAGTGYKVKVGEFNLAGVSADGKVYLDGDPKKEEPEVEEEEVEDSYDLPDEESEPEDKTIESMKAEDKPEDKSIKSKHASSSKSHLRKT